MKLADCARSLIRNSWLVLLVGVIAGAAAYAVASSEADHYESAGRLVLGLAPNLDAPQNGQALNNIGGRELIATFAEVAGSDEVRIEALKAAGVTVGQSEYTLTTARLPEANGIEVRVNGPTPRLTQAIAVQAMDAGSTKFLTLYPDYIASPVQQPTVPTTRVSPKPKSMGIIALMLGLILGFLLGLALDRVRAHRGVKPITSLDA
jgi:capsular polysaccharide biosynthesis protein